MFIHNCSFVNYLFWLVTCPFFYWKYLTLPISCFQTGSNIAETVLKLLTHSPVPPLCCTTVTQHHTLPVFTFLCILDKLSASRAAYTVLVLLRTCNVFFLSSSPLLTFSACNLDVCQLKLSEDVLLWHLLIVFLPCRVYLCVGEDGEGVSRLPWIWISWNLL